MDERRFVIADRERLERVLDRLCARVHGALDPEYELVGVLRRGAPLARALGRRLATLWERDLRVGELRLERYADDLSVLHPDTRLEERPLPFDVDGAKLLLVDDVIYSGRTLLKASCHLADLGATEIRTVALCSRGGPEVPVGADFVGMRLDVGSDHVVEVHAPPFDDRWGVALVRRTDVVTD